MKYVIMAGGSQHGFEIPRHLTKINGEPLLARTIRLLRENGIKDIAVSSDNEQILEFVRQMPGVEVVAKDSRFLATTLANEQWVISAFGGYIDDPVCYLFGDVVFSPKAIKTIVETETDSIEFFASAPPFDRSVYPKRWAEPFAFKVVEPVDFAVARSDTASLWTIYKAFKREPIAWELWQVIKKTPINIIDYTNYTVINDYTCDIDSPEDVEWWNSRRFVD